MRTQQKSRNNKKATRQAARYSSILFSKELKTPIKSSEPQQKDNMNKTGTSRKGQSIDMKDRKVPKKLFVNEKKKNIAKTTTARKGNAEYQNFYKFHFDRLMQEHLNWSNQQVTKITTLLWKRYKESAKMENNQASVKELCDNIISGKEGFRESKIKMGHQEQQIQEMWKRLPVEAKKKWQAGVGAENTRRTKLNSVTFRPSEEGKMNRLSFLHKC